jgi:hypothetical protein
MPSGPELPLYALASWLLTELLGALMVRGWIASGGMRASRQRPARPGAMSLPVLAGHAGLNLIGLVFWICFVASGATALAWLALAFMAPAIGLGISTVTIWTPYPGGRQAGEGLTSGPLGPSAQPGVMPEEELKRRLSDEALTAQLVEDLVSRNFSRPSAGRSRAGWNLRPLIPLSHGVLAIVTFLLAVLAAIAAI